MGFVCLFVPNDYNPVIEERKLIALRTRKRDEARLEGERRIYIGRNDFPKLAFSQEHLALVTYKPRAWKVLSEESYKVNHTLGKHFPDVQQKIVTKPPKPFSSKLSSESLNHILCSISTLLYVNTPLKKKKK